MHAGSEDKDEPVRRRRDNMASQWHAAERERKGSHSLLMGLLFDDGLRGNSLIIVSI